MLVDSSLQKFLRIRKTLSTNSWVGLPVEAAFLSLQQVIVVSVIIVTIMLIFLSRPSADWLSVIGRRKRLYKGGRRNLCVKEVKWPALSLCFICTITHLHIVMYFCMSIVVIIKESSKHLLLHFKILRHLWVWEEYERNLDFFQIFRERVNFFLATIFHILLSNINVVQINWFIFFEKN